MNENFLLLYQNMSYRYLFVYIMMFRFVFTCHMMLRNDLLVFSWIVVVVVVVVDDDDDDVEWRRYVCMSIWRVCFGSSWFFFVSFSHIEGTMTMCMVNTIQIRFEGENNMNENGETKWKTNRKKERKYIYSNRINYIRLVINKKFLRWPLTNAVDYIMIMMVIDKQILNSQIFMMMLSTFYIKFKRILKSLLIRLLECFHSSFIQKSPFLSSTSPLRSSFFFVLFFSLLCVCVCARLFDWCDGWLCCILYCTYNTYIQAKQSKQTRK